MLLFSILFSVFLPPLVGMLFSFGTLWSRSGPGGNTPAGCKPCRWSRVVVRGESCHARTCSIRVLTATGLSCRPPTTLGRVQTIPSQSGSLLSLRPPSSLPPRGPSPASRCLPTLPGVYQLFSCLPANFVLRRRARAGSVCVSALQGGLAGSRPTLTASWPDVHCTIQGYLV